MPRLQDAGGKATIQTARGLGDHSMQSSRSCPTQSTRGRWPLLAAIGLPFLLSWTALAADGGKETPTKNDTPAAKKTDEAKPDPVTPGDVLSFRQAKVAAEMTELEERMYRLS